ncbi:hypothetical protein KCQ_03896 [Pectobacterium atrosepticum ICMP 1526]|nr:hypothetical protein KCQ_03896 [Pectobacterium atrosepticum ICMP 1526]
MLLILENVFSSASFYAKGKIVFFAEIFFSFF